MLLENSTTDRTRVAHGSLAQGHVKNPSMGLCHWEKFHTRFLSLKILLSSSSLLSHSQLPTSFDFSPLAHKYSFTMGFTDFVSDAGLTRKSLTEFLDFLQQC